MSENQRLKILRKHLKKTQEELAIDIGVKQNSISVMEKEGNTITDNIKKMLVILYDVNIQWLESGVGSMLNSDVNSLNNSGKENQTNQIPMYNLPATAGEVEVYNNPDDVKVIGYLNIPGAHKESVALPAYGHSMYPTIANGDWAVSRPINDPTEIVWGEVYYIEWSDYKMYKRLLRDKTNEQNVLLWSDNQEEKIGDNPKYDVLAIKKESIRKLRIVTEILKKPNY